MSDWNVGDLALCIKGGIITRPGKVYTVREMKIAEPGKRVNDVQGGIRIVKKPELWFKFLEVNHTPKNWAASVRFIKVTPEEEDEFDREIIDLMQNKKRKTKA